MSSGLQRGSKKWNIKCNNKKGEREKERERERERQIDKCEEEQVEKQLYMDNNLGGIRALDGWMDECKNGWMDGWMDGWKDGTWMCDVSATTWTAGRTGCFFLYPRRRKR